MVLTWCGSNLLNLTWPALQILIDWLTRSLLFRSKIKLYKYRYPNAGKRQYSRYYTQIIIKIINDQQCGSSVTKIHPNPICWLSPYPEQKIDSESGYKKLCSGSLDFLAPGSESVYFL
jgi:hypothetical protein